VFAPSFGGISNSTIHWGLKFTGFTTAANDASNSSNFGLVDFEVLRTDSTTNPFNGTLSNVVNRRAFTFRNGTSNLMTIMSSGNVGIGTTAPGSKLVVQGVKTSVYSPTAISDDFFTVRNLHNNGGTNQHVGIALSVSSNNGSSNGIVQLLSVAPTSGASTADFVVQTRNAGTTAERMRLTSVGNLGIGTNAPATILTVATTTNTDGIQIRRNSTANNDYSTLGFRITTVEATQNFAEIRGVRTNRLASLDTDLRFATTTAGTLAERMTIRDDGNVGIGTTTPATKLHVNGNVLLGSSYVTPSGSPWNTTNSQLILGGAHNAEFNNGNAVKLLITGHNNDSPTEMYPILVEDENGLDDFWLKARASASLGATMYLDGNFGIGTTTPSALLTINNGESNGAFAVQSLATNDYIATFRDSDGENVFKASGSVADSDLVVAFGDVNDAGSAVNYKILSDKHVFSGSVGIGTSSSALSDTLTVNGSAKVGSLKIDDIHVQDTATVTTTATTQTVLATYAVATYATGKFLIQATSGGNRHISELLVTHNGTVSTATEYAILKTAGNLFTVTTDISGGNVRILVTSVSATSTVYKTTFTLIGV
jgi:hypothetical protein